MTFLKHSLVYQWYRKIRWFLLEKEYEGTIELMIFRKKSPHVVARKLVPS